MLAAQSARFGYGSRMEANDVGVRAFVPLSADYSLALLGWKAFQDLCVAVAEECLRRPVQTFLPTNDAGRDGAFVGRWDAADPAAGESTIQCKFTSRPGAGSAAAQQIGRAHV